MIVIQVIVIMIVAHSVVIGLIQAVAMKSVRVVAILVQHMEVLEMSRAMRLNAHAQSGLRNNAIPSRYFQ